MKQSTELRDFYRAYHAWLNGDHSVNFSKSTGLCYNLVWKFKSNKNVLELEEEMQLQFVSAGLYKSYPFNNSGNEYSSEGCNLACHLNEKRIQWVIDHLEV